jgi:transcriptional regulator with XRE-family HTH domain
MACPPLAAPYQLELWTDGAVDPKPASERLRSARNRAGMTQRSLAAALGVSQPTVSRWEAGFMVLTLEDALLAAKRLSCPLDDLLGPSPAFPDRKWRQNCSDSARCARAIPPNALPHFVAAGGSGHALRLARDARQPLAIGQAFILRRLGLLDV